MARPNDTYIEWSDKEGETLWRLYKGCYNVGEACRKFLEYHNENGRSYSSARARLYRMTEWGHWYAKDAEGNPINWTDAEDLAIIKMYKEKGTLRQAALCYSEMHPHRSYEACMSRLDRLRKPSKYTKKKLDIPDQPDKDTTDYYTLDVGIHNIRMREQIFAEMEALR